MAEERKTSYDFGKKCVCVGRVSTSIQSQTAQINDLKDFAKSWGYEEVQTFFTTESGFLEYDEKQGWNLVADFFDTHPDYRVLICPEISRLSRKEHILHKIKDYLIDNRIQLIIKDINFILFNEWGEIPKGNDIIFALYASLADSEMRQKKERFSRALKDYRQLGYSIGGKELFGYERYYEKKDGKNRSRYKINEKEAEEIRTLYRWYVFGIDGDLQRSTILNITKECIERGFSPYLHSKRNVNKCLKEQAYTGLKETHNRVKNPDYWNYHKHDAPKYIPGQSYICAYPPILTGDDAALFDLSLKRMKSNNSRYSGKGDLLIDKSSKRTNILAKLLQCPICGTYLNSSYRMYQQKDREHLGKRLYATYRCNNSRGVVQTCSFKRSISMPMMDSVIWSYCRAAVYEVIATEASVDVDSRISVIEQKINNIAAKIQEYDINRIIKAEDTILRNKMKVLKDASLIDAAVKEYEEHIANSEKELNGFKARKLELEQERDGIKSGIAILGSIDELNEISSSKRQLYKYIHKVVDRVEFIAWDKYHLVIKVHFKKAFQFYDKNDYICIYSKTTMEITALMVHSYDTALKQETIQQKVQDSGLHLNDKVVWALELAAIDELPSTNQLVWDKEEEKFKIENFSFTLNEMKAYFDTPLPRKDTMSSVEGAPVHIKKLEILRLHCYEEDVR